MKIWVIGRGYPAKNNRMRGSFELEQANMLARAGHEVSYIAAIFHPYKKIKSWGYCRFDDVGGVPVYAYSVPYLPERIPFHWKAMQGRVWRTLLAHAEKEQGVPDVIHVHYPGLVTIVDEILAYQKKGTAVVVTDHWTKTLKNTMDAFQRAQLTRYAHEADAVLCVSGMLRQALQRVTGTDKPITIVPNVVSATFAPSTVQRDDGEIRFVGVGRLEPHKQFDKVVEAFADVFRGDERVKLTIVGGGKQLEMLKKMVAERGIEKQVTLTGTLPREETAKAIAAADVLVSYSKLETFGVPVIEAWACGKPVIASTDVVVLDEWNEKLGLQISSTDMCALKEAMETMRQTVSTYDAAYMADFAQCCFGEAAVSAQLSAIYEEVTNRQGRIRE